MGSSKGSWGALRRVRRTSLVRPFASSIVAAAAFGLLNCGGCAVRTGGRAAAVQGERAQPTWMPGYSDGATITLGAESSAVTLVELATTTESRLYELRRSGDGPSVAELKGPGFTIRWGATPPTPPPASADGPDRRPVTRTWAVASSDVRPPVEATDGETLEFLSFVQSLVAPVRLRPLFVASVADGAPRGVCVVLPGLGGWTSVEDGLLALVDRGWTVVAVMPDLMREHRVRIRASFRPPEVRPADVVAKRVETELADDAFVVETVLRQLVRETPEIADRPLVLVGSSLGALGLPAIAARIDQARAVASQDAARLPAVSAAVLIGGGAGLGELMCESPLGRQWLTLANVDLESTDLAALRARIDAECSTAPERCLWALDGRPVLLVDALFDAIVPRRSANRLWESLGEPQRWSYPVGHIGLFLLLGDDTWGQVVDWIDAMAGLAAAPAPAVPAAPAAPAVP